MHNDTLCITYELACWTAKDSSVVVERISIFKSGLKEKIFEILDPDLKTLDPRILLKKDGYMEKVKMKTNLEPLRTICDHGKNELVLASYLQKLKKMQFQFPTSHRLWGILT